MFLLLSTHVLAVSQDSLGEHVSIDIAVSNNFIVLKMKNLDLENMNGMPITEELGDFDITDVFVSNYICVNSSVEIYRPKNETMSSVNTLYHASNTTTIQYFPVNNSKLLEIQLSIPGEEYVASQYDFTRYTVNLYHILSYDIPNGGNVTIDLEEYHLTPYPYVIEDDSFNNSERVYFYGHIITQAYKVFTHPIDYSTLNLLDQIDYLERNLELYENEIIELNNKLVELDQIDYLEHNLELYKNETIELNNKLVELTSEFESRISECNAFKVGYYSLSSERDDNKILAEEYLQTVEVQRTLTILSVILIPVAYLMGKRN